MQSGMVFIVSCRNGWYAWHDISGSYRQIRKFDLNWGKSFKLTYRGSSCIRFGASRHEKHDSVKHFLLPFLVEMFFFYLQKSRYYQQATKKQLFCLTWVWKSRCDISWSCQAWLDSKHPKLFGPVSFFLFLRGSIAIYLPAPGSGGVPPPRCASGWRNSRCGRGLENTRNVRLQRYNR